MAKPIIAFDLDDVLVDSTEFWRNETNRRTGSNIQPEHFKVPGEYSSYYEQTWVRHEVDHLISIDDIDKQMVIDQSEMPPFKGAYETLLKLKLCYELIAVTARNADQEAETKRWLKEAYPDMVTEIVFGNGQQGLAKKNKGQICKEVGAEWLIDDNPSHCEAALAHNIQPVLFGEYGWHVGHELSKDIVRCKDWRAVQEYFDGRPG